MSNPFITIGVIVVSTVVGFVLGYLIFLPLTPLFIGVALGGFALAYRGRVHLGELQDEQEERRLELRLRELESEAKALRQKLAYKEETEAKAKGALLLEAGLHRDVKALREKVEATEKALREKDEALRKREEKMESVKEFFQEMLGRSGIWSLVVDPPPSSCSVSKLATSWLSSRKWCPLAVGRRCTSTIPAMK